MLLSRRGELLAKVLATIGNAAITVAHHPGRNPLNVYRMAREFRDLQYLSNRRLRTISRYLVDKKYVVIRKTAHGIAEISMSKSGKKLVERDALLALKPTPQAEWDRLWRLVMFDIPTRRKATRDRFAGILKTLGFVHYQKSVFLCPHPCEEELEAIVDYLDIDKYVDIVIAKMISRESQYRREF